MFFGIVSALMKMMLIDKIPFAEIALHVRIAEGCEISAPLAWIRPIDDIFMREDKERC